VIETLAATLTDAALAKTFRQEALARLPTAPPLSAREAAKRAFGGLTTRERDVAALIAQGHSNKEIAEAMTLSPRTVEAHITNILGKLNLTSRAQIVAWALEKELVKRKSSFGDL
jgi:DNA-binding NarL/FixJ family response regulator